MSFRLSSSFATGVLPIYLDRICDGGDEGIAVDEALTLGGFPAAAFVVTPPPKSRPTSTIAPESGRGRSRHTSSRRSGYAVVRIPAAARSPRSNSRLRPCSVNGQGRRLGPSRSFDRVAERRTAPGEGQSASGPGPYDVVPPRSLCWSGFSEGVSSVCQANSNLRASPSVVRRRSSGSTTTTWRDGSRACGSDAEPNVPVACPMPRQPLSRAPAARRRQGWLRTSPAGRNRTVMWR